MFCRVSSFVMLFYTECVCVWGGGGGGGGGQACLRLRQSRVAFQWVGIQAQIILTTCSLAPLWRHSHYLDKGVHLFSASVGYIFKRNCPEVFYFILSLTFLFIKRSTLMWPAAVCWTISGGFFFFFFTRSRELWGKFFCFCFYDSPPAFTFLFSVLLLLLLLLLLLFLLCFVFKWRSARALPPTF